MTVGIPALLDTAQFADPATRNVAINASYQELDLALTAYLGKPFVANWATFGKHASAHVGHEMAEATESLQLLDGVGDLDQLCHDLEHGNPAVALRDVRAMMHAVESVPLLLNRPHILEQSGGLALAFFREALTDLRAALDAAHGLDNVRATFRVLCSRLPKIRTEIQAMKDELADGNRRIYDNIAPCLAEFLACVLASSDGVPAELAIPSDDRGFMVVAFRHYVAARKLTNQLRDPAHVGDAALLAHRLAEVKLANMILVTHEQMIAQPDYDGMVLQMNALRGRMTMEDPTGSHLLLPAGGNWGNFYERLGYDATRAPSDFRLIDPNQLPPLLPPSDARYQGSIADYFERNAEESRLEQPPKPAGTIRHY